MIGAAVPLPGASAPASSWLHSEEVISSIFVVTGSMSFLACAGVLLCWAGTPSLSRFPSRMLLWRLICDAILALAFVALNLQQLVAWHSSAYGGSGESACSSLLAFFAQFALFGSLSWFACLAFDLYLSISRPFTRPVERSSMYHGWAWTGAALTGLAVGYRPAYRPVDHLCWAAADYKIAGIDSTWLVFLGWVLGYSALSGCALLYSASLLARGGEKMAARLAPRLTALRASRLYTAAFAGYWAVLGAVYACLYLKFDGRFDGRRRGEAEQGGGAAAPALRAAFAALLGLLGLWDSLAWCAVQHLCYPGVLRNGCAECRGRLRALAAGLSARLSALQGRTSPAEIAPRSQSIGSRAMAGAASAARPATAHGSTALPEAGPLLAGLAACSIRGADRETDLSDALRHEIVRHTLLGIVASTRAANAEAACATPARGAKAARPGGGGGGGGGGATPKRVWDGWVQVCRDRGLLTISASFTYDGGHFSAGRV